MRDARSIARHLEALGHRVTMIDVERAKLVQDEGVVYVHEGETAVRLSSFDGATLRCPTELPGSRVMADAARACGVPIYQDYPMLVAAGDKMLSQALFELHEVPTPKTYGLSYADHPRLFELKAFIASLGVGPFVVKSNRGWNAEQVDILDHPADAVRSFLTFHSLSKGAGIGGALIQEFIESNPVRRRDYRIHTIVGLDSAGELSGTVVAAAQRRAQPGMRITNVSKGAEKIRVSLDVEEARAFYARDGKMAAGDFDQMLENGDIEILSAGLADVAIRAAKAFGVGSLGVDVIVRDHDARALVIEVNPFAGGSADFEAQYGFEIYRPWADAFAGFASAAISTAKGGAQHERAGGPD